jgi:hypothetical protein
MLETVPEKVLDRISGQIPVGRLDPDEHLAVARLGPGDVLDAQRPGEVMNDGGLHGAFR